EVLDDLLVDVLAPVVDPQGGALLGGQAVGDAARVGRDRPGHGVVGAGQLGPGAGGGPAGVTLPAGRQQDPAGDGQGRGGGTGEEGSAADRHGCLLPCRWAGNYNKLNIQSMFGVTPGGPVRGSKLSDVGGRPGDPGGRPGPGRRAPGPRGVG